MSSAATETKRILHLVPSFQRRGAELFAVSLAFGLSRHGYQVRLVSLFPSEDKIGAAQLPDVECYSSGIFRLNTVMKLRREYEKFTPDIVLAHGGEPFKYAVLARGCRPRPAIIYRKIGLSDQWLRSWRFLRLPFHRWLQKRADGICCVAEEVRGEVTGLFRVPEGKARVIYGGVDFERFKALPEKLVARAALSIDHDKKVLISVGALGWEKNQEAMLRALVSLRRDEPGALLLLVGDGPERARLERLAAELGITDAVRFLGVCNNVPEVLAAADLFVMTSLTEGLPGVLVEAGMAGLPSVAWDVAGTREVVLDGITGIVPPYRDELAFAGAVLRLLNDASTARRMGAAAREFCSERFSMQRCVDEHIRMFQDVLGGGQVRN